MSRVVHKRYSIIINPYPAALLGEVGSAGRVSGDWKDQTSRWISLIQNHSALVANSFSAALPD